MWKRVVAVALVGGLVAGGASALLDHHPAPPPEGTIAYSAADLRDVLVARADGSGVRRLTSAPGPQFDPSFSPDGSMIAYRDSRHGINQDDEIWVMDRDGGHPRNLTRHHGNDWSPAWSPDGRTIAFASTLRARWSCGRWRPTARTPGACRADTPSTPRGRLTGRGSPSRA
jgi:dipeptidyl aminopeptidase/acylaminoacyl peptidase